MSPRGCGGCSVQKSAVIYTESTLVVVAESNMVNKPIGNTIKLFLGLLQYAS